MDHEIENVIAQMGNSFFGVVFTITAEEIKAALVAALEQGEIAPEDIVGVSALDLCTAVMNHLRLDLSVELVGIVAILNERRQQEEEAESEQPVGVAA